jgi:hypothetical protein
MDKNAQHLPADGGVRIEQPVHYGHAAECNKLMRSTREDTRDLARPKRKGGLYGWVRIGSQEIRKRFPNDVSALG